LKDKALKRYIEGMGSYSLGGASSISQELTDVLDAIAAASLVIDSQGIVVRASASALSLGLVQSHMLIHKSLSELVTRARGLREAIDGEFDLITGLRGERSYVYARAARISSGQVLLIVEDRTESKRVDETRRDFIANISHELKTPIGAISLLAEALQDGSDDPELVKRFSASLQREATRLGSLVQDIIQLSRVQSAESNTNFAPVDLAGIISDAVERTQVLADRRGISIKAATPAGHIVFGDSEALGMAIKNLIENAVIYSDEDSQVGVGLRAVDGVAEVTVIDNGIGISVEDQERIFERFYRVDPSRSRQTGGTGLGLAIVKHVALNHRGEVRLFSQPGTGSTFTLRIPEMPAQLTETGKEPE
jgi:two-component system sensor histidine kinase SenX3